MGGARAWEAGLRPGKDQLAGAEGRPRSPGGREPLWGVVKPAEAGLECGALT